MARSLTRQAHHLSHLLGRIVHAALSRLRFGVHQACVSISGTYISQLIVEAFTDVVGSRHLGLAFYNKAIVELANAAIVRRSLLLAENDLVSILVTSCLRIVQVAADDLVTSHHDVGSSIVPGHVPTVALVVRDLIVWCKDGL